MSGPHTYYVGDDTLLVHNCPLNGSPASSSPANKPEIESASFAQTTYGESFSEGGALAGRTVDDVASDLQSGAMSPADVSIQVIQRDGNTLILNTGSAVALTRAGIPRSLWVVQDMTGDADAELRLSAQLLRNKLTSVGTSVVMSFGGVS